MSAFRRPVIMGIVNVTPDSFSDGGRAFETAAAVAQAERLVAQGAQIIDVGGESTRPGAAPVLEVEELARVVPVVRALRERLPPEVTLSIDTSKPAVAEAALAAGAGLVNDVTGLLNPAMRAVARAAKARCCVMHMQGSPRTMQDAPVYEDVVAEVTAELARRVEFAVADGLPREHLVVDPGIGFGKTFEHNLALLRGLDALRALGLPVLVGVSRKAFVGKLLGGAPIAGRDPASAQIAAHLATRGLVDVIRVHDVAQTKAALDVAQALA